MMRHRASKTDDSGSAQVKPEGDTRPFAFFVNHSVAIETFEPFLEAVGASRCSVLVEDLRGSAAVEVRRLMSDSMPDLEIVKSFRCS